MLTGKIKAELPEPDARIVEADAPTRGFWLRKAAIFTIVITVPALTIGLLLYVSGSFLEQTVPIAATRIAIAMILAALPLLISYAQSIARDRQMVKLESIRHAPAARTTHYRVAFNAVSELRPVSLDRHYTLPMMTLAIVLILGFILIAFTSLFGGMMLSHPSYLLGGIQVLEPTEEAGDSFARLSNYQTMTFVALTSSFLGSYVYTLYRLLERVTNNDIYPISYYYYAARIVIACVVAVVVRHSLALLGVTSSEAIILISFAIGFAPDLFIVSLLRKAFQMIKIVGSQDDPDSQYMPKNLSLFMIEGMSREKIDRLNELGIENAFILSCQNPFVLWPRLPFDLTLIVDWIAQAQLYRWVKEDGVSALRKNKVNNIFEFYEHLHDDESRAYMSAAAGMAPETVKAFLRGLDSDPSFGRLLEVRHALAVLPPASPAEEVVDTEGVIRSQRQFAA